MPDWAPPQDGPKKLIPPRFVRGFAQASFWLTKSGNPGGRSGRGHGPSQDATLTRMAVGFVTIQAFNLKKHTRILMVQEFNLKKHTRILMVQKFNLRKHTKILMVQEVNLKKHTNKRGGNKTTRSDTNPLFMSCRKKMKLTSGNTPGY